MDRIASYKWSNAKSAADSKRAATKGRGRIDNAQPPSELPRMAPVLAEPPGTPRALGTRILAFLVRQGLKQDIARSVADTAVRALNQPRGIVSIERQMDRLGVHRHDQLTIMAWMLGVEANRMKAQDDQVKVRAKDGTARKSTGLRW